MKKFALTLVTLILAACAHTVDLQSFDHGTGKFNELKGRKVAIVLDPGLIQDNYSSSSDVHTLEFKNVSAGIGSALKDRLTGNTQSVAILTPAQLKTNGDFDFVLYPEFQARAVNDFWAIKCLVMYRLTVRSREGKQVGHANNEAKRIIHGGEDETGCKDALSSIFNSVNDDALGSI